MHHKDHMNVWLLLLPTMILIWRQRAVLQMKRIGTVVLSSPPKTCKDKKVLCLVIYRVFSLTSPNDYVPSLLLVWPTGLEGHNTKNTKILEKIIYNCKCTFVLIKSGPWPAFLLCECCLVIMLICWLQCLIVCMSLDYCNHYNQATSIFRKRVQW